MSSVLVEIDRLAPTRRPPEQPIGFQRWRRLLFMHWTIPADLLRPLIPAELELDRWRDEAYVGLVPFEMEGVRPAWCPERFAFTFLETNVRTYVIHRGRPGVYFFSLDAASRLAVGIARWRWSLPYFYALMSTELRGDRVRYAAVRQRDGAKLAVEYQPGDSLGPSLPGTREHFLLERYLLFVHHGGRIHVGQVHHPPYPAYQADILSLDDSLVSSSGIAVPTSAPVCAHYSPGVDVEIFPLRRA